MTSDTGPPRLTVAITTRNRSDVLIEAIRSLRLLAPMALEILVVDDASDEPIEPGVGAALGPDFPWPVRIIRHEVNTGYIPARNEMAREAAAPLVMSLDDDARLIDAESVTRALETIEADPGVGAIAFTQLKADGAPFEAGGQPAPVDYDCQVASFLGYAHIVRKDLFLRLGGYRELFWYYGEESEFCKRLLASGSKVVYLPRSRVIHDQSPVGRSILNRIRYGCRNACLDAMYNEPLPRVLASVPARIINYARWRKGACRYHGISDKGGLRWIVGQLLGNAPAVWRERRSLGWSTYGSWKQLRHAPPPYAVRP
jgi:GT2 family glycosyltransferase